MAEKVSARTAWALARAIKGAVRPRADGSTHTATFVRRDADGTCWVRLAGNDFETPVNGGVLADAEPGQMVQCSVDGTTMTMIGNATTPAVGSSYVDGEVNVVVKQVDAIRTEVVETAELVADKASVGQLEAESARIDSLQAATADIDTIRANSAKVQNLTAAQLEADHATIGTLDTTYATIANLDAANGRITNLESTKADISDLEADYITADEIEATYMHANMSNSDVAWIENGTIKNGAIVSAMINDVSANKLTAGTINGSVINVTNLNADNITTGTINGQRIGEGSLSLSKLEDDVYTETEVNNIVDGLNDRIDGAIETHTGTAVPTLNNSPASSWNTTKLRDEHVGDVYYVVNSQSQQNGYCYRFTKSGSTYSWQLIKDSDVTAALSRLTTAEGKITTFDSDISKLKTDTGTLTTKTESLETRMSDAEADILDKVDTTTFNEVSDTVDQHSQTISQHTTAISNKADSSTVTDVTNRVSKNEQDISGINTTIGELQETVESKADGSTVSTISNKLNTVSDTVDGHTQTLTSVQNTLSSKADSSTVSTLTTKVNNVSDTVDGHTSQLSSITSTQTSMQTTLDKTVKSSIQLWYSKANTTAPSKPTSQVTSTSTSGNAWRIVVPAYNASYPHYFYCWQYEYVDGTYGWSTVVRDIAMGESQATARTADSTANANIKSSVQLWFTKANSTAPNKPTSVVSTSNANTANAWNLVVPVWNKSYPHYFYCYQQQKGDGNYQWTDVVYDRATSEAQQLANTTSTNLSTFQTNYATFKQQTEQFESTVGTTYATKTELKGATDDITELEGRVSTNETSISNNASTIALKANSSDVYTKSGVDGLISTEVTNRNAAITAKANEITSSVSETYATKSSVNDKADASDVTALAGRVSTAESSITQNATNINAKVSKNDVINQINLSTEGAKIQASKVEIDGTAVFNNSAFQEQLTSSYSKTIEYTYSNAGQGTGYAKLANITAKAAYLNLPITFTLYRRGQAAASHVTVTFANGSPTDTLSQAYYDGWLQLYYVRVGTGSYDIYIALGESWDTVKVANFVNPYPSSNMVVTWAGEYYGTSLPSGAVAFTRLIGAETKESYDNKIASAEANAKAYADATKIGGRNLIPWSALSGTYVSAYDKASNGYAIVIPTSTSVVIKDSGDIFDRISSGLLSIGSQATLSFTAVATGSTNLRCDFYPDTYTGAFGNVVSPVTTTPKRYIITGKIENDSSPTSLQVRFWRLTSDANYAITIWDIKLESGTHATDWSPAPEDIVARTQRIWYRSNSATAPAAPTAWVTKGDDGSAIWTKMHVAITSTHKYIYTCEQYEMADGTVGYTSVLLDNTITVIDGGNIITGSVTANKLNASSINASKTLTVGAMTDAAAATILNSNISVGGRNLVVQATRRLGRCLPETDDAYDQGANDGQKHWQSAPIAVKPGEQYSLTTYGWTEESGNNRYVAMHFTTDDLTWINRPVMQAWSSEFENYTWRVTAPDNAAFARVSAPKEAYETKIKFEHGNKATDWTPAPEDVDSAISNAAKTATSYVTEITGGGIMVHPSGDQNTGVRITSDVDIRQGNGQDNVSIANFGALDSNNNPTARVGKADDYHVSIDTDSLDVMDATTTLASFGSEVSLGPTNSNHIRIGTMTNGSKGLSLRSAGASDLEMTSREFFSPWSSTPFTFNMQGGNQSVDFKTSGVEIWALGDPVESSYAKAVLKLNATIGTANQVGSFTFQTNRGSNTWSTPAGTILWSGGWHMTSSHEATLKYNISTCPTGIVLHFQPYTSNTIRDYYHNYVFVPKVHATGISVHLCAPNFQNMGTKYLYVYDAKIVGNDDNNKSGTNSGITYNNALWVMTQVIAV